jgi:hypothetical protein
MAATTAKALAAALVLVARAEAGACDGTRVPTSVPAFQKHPYKAGQPYFVSIHYALNVLGAKDVRKAL